MTLRVLLLTQWFEPEPTFKGITFAKALRDQGLEVKVITGFPNYPIGKLYPGYKIKPVQHEIIDGIGVTRIPLYPSHDRSVLRRIANYLSFGLSAFVYGVFCAKKTDVIYAYHPPLTVSAAAVGIKLIKRSALVLDIQDLWPDTLKATGMLNNQAVLTIIGWAAGWIYRLSDYIVVLSNGFKCKLLERGVPASKVEVIRNWADENKLEASNECVNLGGKQQDVFNILFAGNIGAAQGIDAVLEAARILKKNRSRVRFVFLGTGLEVDKVKLKAEVAELDNVIFLPPVGMEQVGSYLKSADALLVHLRNDDLFKITIPSKTQAYMAVGKPILMAVEGDASTIVEEAECGELATPEDPLSIAVAADKLAMMSREDLLAMGARGLDYYKRELSLLIGSERFGNIIKRISKND